METGRCVSSDAFPAATTARFKLCSRKIGTNKSPVPCIVSVGRSSFPSKGTSSSYGPIGLRISASSALRLAPVFSVSALRPSPSSMPYLI